MSEGWFIKEMEKELDAIEEGMGVWPTPSPARIHQSETVMMGRCERQWYYTYGPKAGPRAVPNKYMVKGTLWHAFLEEWWVTPGGTEAVDWAKVLDHMGDDAEYLTEQIAADVVWMAERYDTWRDGSFEKSEWRMVEQELEVEVDFMGHKLGGRFDGIVESKDNGDLYLLERKTMSDWRRMDYLTVDPQLTHYMAMAGQINKRIVGVLYEAAKTYRWTRDEHKHPPSDSFREELIVRSPEQIKSYMWQLNAFAARRATLWTASENHCIPNISSNTCNGCFHKDVCWDSLHLAEPGVEWVDDDELAR